MLAICNRWSHRQHRTISKDFCFFSFFLSSNSFFFGGFFTFADEHFVKRFSEFQWTPTSVSSEQCNRRSIFFQFFDTPFFIFGFWGTVHTKSISIRFFFLLVFSFSVQFRMKWEKLKRNGWENICHCIWILWFGILFNFISLDFVPFINDRLFFLLLFFWVQKIFCFLFDFSLDNFSGIHKSSIGCADAGGGSIHIYFFRYIWPYSFLFSFTSAYFTLPIRLSKAFSGRIDTFPIGNWWNACIYIENVFFFILIRVYMLRCNGNVGNHVIFDWNEEKEEKNQNIFTFVSSSLDSFTQAKSKKEKMKWKREAWTEDT